MAKKQKLTAFQKKFVAEIVRDPSNAGAALVRAGSKAKQPAVSACQMLALPHVKEELDRQMEKVAEKATTDRAYVLRQARAIHERCMQEIRPHLDRKGNHLMDEEGNLLYVFDASNAIKSLDLIGKHVDVGAFKSDEEKQARTDPLAASLLEFIFRSVAAQQQQQEKTIQAEIIE